MLAADIIVTTPFRISRLASGCNFAPSQKQPLASHDTHDVQRILYMCEHMHMYIEYIGVALFGLSFYV